MNDRTTIAGRLVVEEYYLEQLRRWDFEELLTALRHNPVMRGDTDDCFIVAQDYLACA
ncbi:hypothetical protein KDL29_04540 [bacterium]|nr:hypothetical protein [bacterium]MCB1219213.1 hypothetical protein [bacterium]UNM09572.1 MAG: hypothetical protein H7A35_05795 [Planctomycetales bacterium]